MTTTRPAVTSCALLLLMPDCSVPPDSRLQMGGDWGEVCVPIKEGQSMLIGEFATAPSGGTTIADVYLKNARGAKVVESYVLPDGDESIGTSAAGDYNVVLRVERTAASPGAADAMEVRYAFGARQGDAGGTTRYVFADKCF